MSTIEFGSESGRVSISWSFDGDYYIAIEAEADGFRGHSDGHVLAAEFRDFGKAIGILEQRRQGQARFESVPTGLFEVVLHSTDRVGHLAIRGVLRIGDTEGDGPSQEYRFLLPVEPDQLVRADSILQKSVVE